MLDGFTQGEVGWKPSLPLIFLCGIKAAGRRAIADAPLCGGDLADARAPV